MGYASPNIRTEWSRHGNHTVVRVAGDPALHEFFSFVSWLSVETESWSVRRLLLDLREVRSMQDVEDLRLAGNAVGVALPHVDKVASVVPGHMSLAGGRCGHDAEDGPRPALSAFTDERGALNWLLAG